MARKRRTTTRRKRTYRKNPRVRSYTRRAARSARSTLKGLNFKGALKNVIPFQFGMFASKWLAKRFGGGASETAPESWGWKEYLQGGLGAVAAGFVAQMVKPGTGQKVLEGGLNLMIYEMIQNELIAGSAWATGQFGADETSYLPGDVEQDETGRNYLLGEDYQWRALPETTMGETLQPVGPLGETLEPVGPLGADPYARALLDN